MESAPLIGVLALQGAVEEHILCLKKCGCNAKEIKYVEDLEGLDGLILPGGESTTMAIVGEKLGVFPALKDYVQSKKPIWGTCAGMILLSDHAIMQKEGGQTLIGGLDVKVCRNFFGSQIHSREVNIPLNKEETNEQPNNQEDTFKAVFIRAPAILKTGPGVKVLATIASKPHASAVEEVMKVLDASSDMDQTTNDVPVVNVVVAVQQENILATAFHPELTDDLRWHRMFVDMVKEWKFKNN